MNMKRLTESDASKLDEVYNKIETAAGSFIGYPCNEDFGYSELLRFMKYPVNNIGDPYTPSNYHLNTHEIEREVLDFFAKITHADDNFWGYVTNGGTEGNLYGLYLARELYPLGVVYHSEDVHYSVAKSIRLLRMRSIMIRSMPNGELDYRDLKEAIKVKREFVPIIFATIGTTMKGAVDNISKIQRVMKDLAISDHYIHCDCALSGMIFPFADGAPGFDFKAGADSMSISGHKFIGSPIPCGVALAKRKNVEKISKFIEYVGTMDTTITGSRNGITPLFLWYAIKKHGEEGFKKWVKHCFSLAEYAMGRLNELGRNAWKNDFGITVVFDRPPEKIVKKWQLAPEGDLAHIVLMPGTSKERVDAFIEDLRGCHEKNFCNQQE